MSRVNNGQMDVGGGCGARGRGAGDPAPGGGGGHPIPFVVWFHIRVLSVYSPSNMYCRSKLSSR